VLGTIVRQTGHRGCVTACGLVGGANVPLTVYPFILRGVELKGIDSAMCPWEERLEVWSKLAGPWKTAGLEELATEIELAGIEREVERILAGQVTGRVVVKLGE
jgi:NADPH:quinone reductase-like Zn-dependent oxidoreductase